VDSFKITNGSKTDETNLIKDKQAPGHNSRAKSHKHHVHIPWKNLVPKERGKSSSYPSKMPIKPVHAIIHHPDLKSEAALKKTLRSRAPLSTNVFI